MYLRQNMIKAYTNSGAQAILVYYAFLGILLTLTPVHVVGLNVTPIRISDFENYCNRRGNLSSIGSGITFVSWF